MKPSVIRTLVVDDSALYRKFVASVLNEIPEVEVVGTASNGRIGLEKIKSLQPDMITLDLEMPVLDGLGLLRELADQKIDVASIIISSITAEGAKATNAALHLGAFDFVLKPIGEGPDESRRQLERDLAPKIHACIGALRSRIAKSPAAGSSVRESKSDDSIERMTKSVDAIRRDPSIVCIGVSTGGPVALNQVLPKLPADFPCPILLVQHMPPLFTKNLADDLNQKCALDVQEATNGMAVEAGHILIAPGGSQMRIAQVNGKPIVQITNDPPEKSCKPSVDYLFRSIAHLYGNRTVAAILTGMGDDGTLGCKLLKRAGALIVTEDEPSCVVYGMPRSVVEAGVADQVVPLEGVADCLMAAVGRGAIA